MAESMPDQASTRAAFELARDPRGAQVHVLRKDTGECVGCIEAGLYEIVRSVIRKELAAPAAEDTSAGTATRAM
jgi:hypothetical protein